MTRRRRNTQTNYSANTAPGAVVINVPGAERLPDNKQQAEKEELQAEQKEEREEQQSKIEELQSADE